jgi:hypothetical protein
LQENTECLIPIVVPLYLTWVVLGRRKRVRAVEWRAVMVVMVMVVVGEKERRWGRL